MVPIIPGLAGSGKFRIGRPFVVSPSTSIDAAPASPAPPLQVTDSVPDDPPPPQPTSASERARQASRRMKLLHERPNKYELSRDELCRTTASPCNHARKSRLRDSLVDHQWRGSLAFADHNGCDSLHRDRLGAPFADQRKWRPEERVRQIGWQVLARAVDHAELRGAQ